MNITIFVDGRAAYKFLLKQILINTDISDKFCLIVFKISLNKIRRFLLAFLNSNQNL